MDIFKVDGTKKISIKDIPTTPPTGYEDKKENKSKLKENVKIMAELQNKLYAQNDYSLLLLFQAMDAAGKDGMIKRVMTGLNPQGTQVFSFKRPSSEELDHDYMWRAHKVTPERGRVGIFNRSYYEDVLVVRVRNLLEARQIPKVLLNENVWDERIKDIKNFEDYMTSNGQVTLKFFLNVSKEEQKNRFLDRINDPTKNWKFSSGDLEERKLWDDYMFAYEEAINKSSSPDAPWFVIPADNKWYARRMVSSIIVEKLNSLGLNYPSISEEEGAKLSECKERLLGGE